MTDVCWDVFVCPFSADNGGGKDGISWGETGCYGEARNEV